MKTNTVVGIASFGMSGRIFHAPLLAHHKDFSIKRIVQRSEGDAQKLYPAIVPTKTFDELLDDKEIDLIIVNTPDNTHFEFAKRSLEAGKACRRGKAVYPDG